ncbi:hypothetical protein A2334_05675 [Candidatus Roizmanbacteria bacterium RIFOXYB2_FULL_38_10]|uniref:Uncharacterized protein n=1 Tax=Candidatus Roizmanbacteria bacterium RIFOXYD1_FULL_38_12 TaxID=1802093 RepID=A0A1F7L0S1_9BACT|nr:MAG: hypothetical protein A3K47_02795 [Candidatus Roizmanbacteria bacterium RIFOXYA2_FULL_38_14]OGK63696.1 MAG: hypothetical protein A3K27_02795 [Candidatus Roizmanbacteria bacterium RIFOXYA1_FULL_37_12]OGK65542.1 MAG: hypothetical protein A3K38_02795 [Candidatus Roizmanbacteria bacterium RIFOXYB1_FULL_40_23]OGK68326.1 MAG: hypothetical protein A2334_05675 [Candidatus Roizmanbacteria bacterium RIFOXYB2_FULL_38_10]OGK69947.1 MAG: hypothetical protein A3K21_02800 [Candidatus Roizmanbacteria ba
MKTVVTHMSVDLDAITSLWLIKTFLPLWEEADIVFAASGSLWNNVVVDSDPDVIYVDTGLGKFDHHQTTEHTCASKRVFEYLCKEGHIDKKIQNGLERLILLVTDLDHFAESSYPDAPSDRYDLSLYQLVGALKYTVGSDSTVVNLTFPFLEAALQVFVNKVKAEKEIKNGYILQSRWGKSILILTNNKEAMKLAQKMGFALVVTKDPDKGFVRIKIPPSVKEDLTPLYEKIKQEDPKAYWYFHVSKHMLLNDASQKPSSIPSSLTLPKLIEIINSL